MTIGTPQDLGSNSSASTPASLAITTTQNIVAKDVIVVSHYCNASGGTTNISGIVDSGGVNVYRPVFSQIATAPLGEIWLCPNATALASGGTITASFAGSGLRHAVNAIRIPGLVNGLPADPHTGLTGTFETSTAVSSPNTPVNNFGALNEIILGLFLSGNAFGTFTAGTGFTGLNTTGGTSAFIYTQYQIVSASAYTTNIQNAASWANSVLHRGMSIGLVGACSC